MKVMKRNPAAPEVNYDLWLGTGDEQHSQLPAEGRMVVSPLHPGRAKKINPIL
jgi:hypothetical protein